jgi:orotate phosphoribosyltransferase
MDHEELEYMLQDCGAIKFGDFTLASGEKSRYYVDIKNVVTKPKLLAIICNHILDEIIDLDNHVDYIACVELGSVPIGVGVSIRTGLDLIIVRKEEKDHGIKSKIVGEFEKDKHVLLVEDVTTTGESVIQGAQVLRYAGLIVKNVISIVDRNEGAEENLRKEELNLIALVVVNKLELLKSR